MDQASEGNNTQSSADLWGHEDPGLLSLMINFVQQEVESYV